jgi:hypothetical protein
MSENSNVDVKSISRFGRVVETALFLGFVSLGAGYLATKYIPWTWLAFTVWFIVVAAVAIWRCVVRVDANTSLVTEHGWTGAIASYPAGTHVRGPLETVRQKFSLVPLRVEISGEFSARNDVMAEGRVTVFIKPDSSSLNFFANQETAVMSAVEAMVKQQMSGTISHLDERKVSAEEDRLKKEVWGALKAIEKKYGFRVVQISVTKLDLTEAYKANLVKDQRVRQILARAEEIEKKIDGSSGFREAVRTAIEIDRGIAVLTNGKRGRGAAAVVIDHDQ